MRNLPIVHPDGRIELIPIAPAWNDPEGAIEICNSLKQLPRFIPYEGWRWRRDGNEMIHEPIPTEEKDACN